MSSDDRVLIMGIGNVLMKDEGVGCRVVEELAQRYRFADTVEIVDSGTMGMMILNLFQDRDFVFREGIAVFGFQIQHADHGAAEFQRDRQFAL